MLLDDVTLPNASITNVTYTKKVVEHQYDRSDTNHVTEMGNGITRVRVSGVCESAAERDAIAAKLMQTGSKLLYYPSTVGETSDRYYTVYTSPPRFTPVSATVYRYEFDALAADPIPYVTATAAHVWS